MAKKQSKSCTISDLIKDLNIVAFHNLYRKGMSIKELKDELDFQGLSIQAYTETTLLYQIIKLFKTNLKESKLLLKKLVDNKELVRWGKLIVTPLMKSYIDSEPGEDIDAGVLQKEGEFLGGENLICPYCKNNKLPVEIKKTEDEYECNNCHKKFKAIVGVVKGVIGQNSYIVRMVEIRIKGINGEEKRLYHSNEVGMTYYSNDRVAFIYRKGILNNERLKYIINWNLKEYAEV